MVMIGHKIVKQDTNYREREGGGERENGGRAVSYTHLAFSTHTSFLFVYKVVENFFS